MTFRPVCDTCGSLPPRYEQVSVLGPLDIARRHLCAGCVAAEDRAVAAAASPGADSAALLELGPIRFDDLRASLEGLHGSEPPELLAWLAERVAAIARHHGQPLPTDLHAFVVRHAGS